MGEKEMRESKLDTEGRHCRYLAWHTFSPPHTALPTASIHQDFRSIWAREVATALTLPLRHRHRHHHHHHPVT